MNCCKSLVLYLMDVYKKELIDLLLKQNYPGWRIAHDQNNIFINIPEDQELEVALEEFKKKMRSLAMKIKSKPTKLGFFIGNSKDSRFYELNA